MRHPRCVSNKSNYKVYAYIVKHDYRLGGMLFTVCKEIRSNADYGQYFHFNAFVDILQKGHWTMAPGVQNVQ